MGMGWIRNNSPGKETSKYCHICNTNCNTNARNIGYIVSYAVAYFERTNHVPNSSLKHSRTQELNYIKN